MQYSPSTQRDSAPWHSDAIIMKDVFGVEYCFSNRCQSADMLSQSAEGSALEERYFSDLYQTVSFIRRLEFSRHQWLLFLRYSGSDTLRSFQQDVERVAAEALIRRKFRVYRISAHKSRPELSVRSRGSEYFVFKKQALEVGQAHRQYKTFSTIAEAQEFIDSTGITDKDLQQFYRTTIAHSGFTPESQYSSDIKRAIAQKIASGEWGVARNSYHYLPTKEKKPNQNLEEAAKDSPGNRVAELAPATDPWLRIVLKDDDSGELLRGIKVKLRLPDGSKAVKTTNEKGEIYLQKIDEGTCDIEEIQDEDGWEFYSLESSG